jgi:predicted phosphodiesterase
MGGINEFSWRTSARRTALFMEQIVQYKPQYRQDTDLVLAVNGDLVSGVIHNQEFFSDLWTVQFSGTVDIMVQAISYLATNFKKVTVEWTTGNHDRIMHKSDKGRASTHKWDSLGSTIAIAVKRIVESTHSNVKVNIPMTPYNIVEIHGHLFFITHGDTVFSTGNVGSSINMKQLNTQIAKLNSSGIGGPRKFAGILLGHVHVSTVQLTESGCMLLINGCLSGSDPYAQSIGVFESHPTQQIVEVTERFAVGDIRMIQLKDADDRSDLDQIIAPFKGKMG